MRKIIARGMDFLTVRSSGAVSQYSCSVSGGFCLGTRPPDRPWFSGGGGGFRETGRRPCRAYLSSGRPAPIAHVLIPDDRGEWRRSLSGCAAFSFETRKLEWEADDASVRIAATSARMPGSRCQPCAALATSAAKSSFSTSIPSPTSSRTKPVIATPAALAALPTVVLPSSDLT